MWERICENKLKTISNNVAFKDWKELLNYPNKGKQIMYEELELKPYLKTILLTFKETNILIVLRSQFLQAKKFNFKNMYYSCVQWPLKCDIQNLPEETQQPLQKCKILSQNQGNTNTDKTSIYGRIKQQSLIEKTRMHFNEKKKKKKILFKQENKASCSSLP